LISIIIHIDLIDRKVKNTLDHALANLSLMNCRRGDYCALIDAEDNPIGSVSPPWT